MPATHADPHRDHPRPAPGSAAAAELGCLCPVLVNGPGAAADHPLIAPDCTVHASSDA